jgi:glycolate oxidase FAD binding subunit
MQFAAREHLRVLPAGAGEHLPPGAGGDFVLSTRRLTRVVEYEPEEMVLVAESGSTLHALAGLAAPHRQRLGPTPHPGHAATLGGAMAAARAGLDRRGRGTLRDVILGARVLHADGRISKTGGKVVKNVTGYDLAKLYTGSFGSLAVILEVNVRLAPAPESTALLSAALPVAEAEVALLQLHRAAIAPVALLWAAGKIDGWPAPRDHVHVVARFEGHAAGVAWQCAEARSILPALEPPADEAAWDSLCRIAEPHAGSHVVRISSLPIAGPEVWSRLATRARDFAFVAQFGVGTAHARLPAAIAVDGLGTHAQVLYAPTGTAAAGTGVRNPPAARLMIATKQALDPDGRLAAIPGIHP